VPAENDPNAVELGLKFRSSTNGFVTAIRFYKGTGNTGTHIVSLWTVGGTRISTATAVGESASGWQEVPLPSAVAITANTTYVASYHTDTGFYSADSNYFAAAPTVNGFLTALQDGTDGGNGVYRYGINRFPNQSFNSTNYWIDVVFQTALPPDTTPPTVLSTGPPNGAPSTSPATASFSEQVNPATVSGTTFEVRDPSNALVSGTVSYTADTQTAAFQPSTPFAYSTTYSARVRGGGIGVRDLAGNPMAADVVWTFKIGGPPPTDGPGGPILVVAPPGSAFATYYAEILRSEGLNEFSVKDLGTVTSTLLAGYDVVILAEGALSAAQVTMFSDWVTNGGNLIAMKPDKQLAALLGLTDAQTTLSEGYIQIDTSAAPGAGITSATMQYHGVADAYTLNGATTIATLFSTATSSTPNPAVTVRSVGAAGGQAAAFTYDLARSVVSTRQGNPAWSGQERDGLTPIRSDDLFFGGTVPNYVDLSKVAIPQADEQQRLLANLIGFLNADRKPLPRFWYLPRGHKAAIVMTGDDHALNGTQGRFDIYNSNSAPGCNVANWECVRATSYIYPTTPISPATAAAFNSQGFEIAIHFTTSCQNYTQSSLTAVFDSDSDEFTRLFPNLPFPRTNRTHCIAWSDYDTQPQVELAHGIRLDTTYYYWPASWVNNTPGLFNGTGMAQRFTKIDGTLLDIYQAATPMTDESGQSYPLHSDVLLDRAQGPEGYYGTFVTNMHTDLAVHAGSQAIVASAQAHGVPIISAQQLLTWLDGRNGSAFTNITWTGSTLGFSVLQDPGANGLQGMVPTSSLGGALAGILRNGVAIDFTMEAIKGVSYARFDALGGAYQVRYGLDTIPPVITSQAVAAAVTTGTATWHTNELATTRIDYGLSPTALVFSGTVAGLTSAHSVSLSGLAANTTYYFRVTSADGAGNPATATGTFTTAPMPPVSVSDTTSADFSAGTLDAGTYVAETADGEVTLSPTAGAEFTGSALPPGWSFVQWNGAGTATVSGGRLAADAVRVVTDSLFPAGRSLEFVATFTGQLQQHAGLGLTLNETPYAIFSTGFGGNLFARTNNGAASLETTLSATYLSSPHRFRIDWTGSAVVYFIDGTQVASHAVAINTDMHPIVSDFPAGGGAVTVDWIRLGPYTTAGTFNSRVLDAGARLQWASVVWNASVPTGTSLAISARFGDTPVPDATWTSFVSLPASGTAVNQASRYVQYRAVLGGDGTQTPALQSITFLSGSPPPSISVSDVTVTEVDTGSSVVANFTLTLSAPMSVPVSVTYATADETATAGADYVATSGTAVFDPGVTSVTVPVTVLGDVLMEPSETFFLDLTAPVNAWLADPQGRATIIDNDLTLVSIGNASVTEGNAGTVNANFVVSLARAITQTVTVDYATNNVTATAGTDYVTTSGTLTFAPGVLQQTVPVPVVGDTINEANETFQVILSNAVNATITTGTGTGTIVNDDPVPSLTIGDATITEGTGGTNAVQLPVTLSTVSGQTVTVRYATSNGSATTADYTNTSGTLTIPAGTTSATVSVPIVTDTTKEPDENFRVTLSVPTNATIARAQATVTILNDDPTPQLSIANTSVTEGNTGTVNATFTVTLSNPSSDVVTATYTTSDGTALAGVDYTATTGTVTFTAGQTSRTFTVPVIGDVLDEPNETFFATLSAPVNALIANAQGTATITDNDAAPSIRISDVTVTEGDTGSVDAVLIVTLSAPSTFTVGVNWATGASTGTPNVDFTPVSGVLSFAPGTTSQQITVPILGDLINEVNETVNVDLTQPVNATIADSRGVITIAENDPLPDVTIDDISVTEGNSGTKTANFTISLSRASSRQVRVNYATADGTATAGTDYTARSGNVTFAAGVTTMTLAITVRGDTTLEPDETVLLNLSAPVNAVIARATGTLTILNDDQ
jgi:hypothetical protein